MRLVGLAVTGGRVKLLICRPICTNLITQFSTVYEATEVSEGLFESSITAYQEYEMPVDLPKDHLRDKNTVIVWEKKSVNTYWSNITLPCFLLPTTTIELP